MKKTKLLFVHHGVGIGGAPISLLKLIKGIDSEKYDFNVVFQLQSEAVTMYEEAGIRVDVVGKFGKYLSHHKKSFISFIRFYKYLKIIPHWLINAFFIAPKYINKYNPSIIHLNSDVLSSWAFAAKRMDVKVVCHVRDPFETHGYFGLRTKLIRSLLNNNVEKFICISNDNLLRLGILNKSTLIYNPFDIPNSFRQPFCSGRALKVLYLGGISKAKGFKFLANSIPKIRSDVQIILAGDYANFRKKLPNNLLGKFAFIYDWIVRRIDYKLLESILMYDNVEYVGLTKSPLKYIDDSDILISPFEAEHFSRPIIEAFSFGKPVIATRIQGMDEIVYDGVNGIMVDLCSFDQIGEAVDQMYTSSELGIFMGLNGRNMVLEKFSVASHCSNVEKIYDSI